MAKHNVRVFPTRRSAEDAVRELKREGYTDDQISLIGRDADGGTFEKDGAGADVAAKRAAEGGTAGAVAGAAGGALVTLGILSGVIPAIGPVVALGALGTTLLNAASSAAAVGIAGALAGWGLSETDAKYYEDQVKAGRFVVVVDDDGPHGKAHGVFKKYGGYDRANAPTSAV